MPRPRVPACSGRVRGALRYRIANVHILGGVFALEVAVVVFALFLFGVLRDPRSFGNAVLLRSILTSGICFSLLNAGGIRPSSKVGDTQRTRTSRWIVGPAAPTFLVLRTRREPVLWCPRQG